MLSGTGSFASLRDRERDHRAGSVAVRAGGPPRPRIVWTIPGWPADLDEFRGGVAAEPDQQPLSLAER